MRKPCTDILVGFSVRLVIRRFAYATERGCVNVVLNGPVALRPFEVLEIVGGVVR